jgi:hypothetical protein
VTALKKNFYTDAAKQFFLILPRVKILVATALDGNGVKAMSRSILAPNSG